MTKTRTKTNKSEKSDLPEKLPKKWSRAVILRVDPEIDGGRFPIKRTIGEAVTVTSNLVGDGHDVMGAELVYGPQGGQEETVRMSFEGNDTYTGTFHVGDPGMWTYRVRAWVDEFGTWLALFRRRVEGGSPEWEIESELKDGASLLEKCAKKAKGEDKKRLKSYIKVFESGDADAALQGEVKELAAKYDPREGAENGRTLEVHVERKLAQFSAWYEFFPRSVGRPGEHGTLDDAAEMLDYVKEMQFDIVYLPPIYPIGKSHRKGKNNTPEAGPDDVGSPWAIGNEDGGHKTVEPMLGGMKAFERFMKRAKALDLEVALDLAYQCSPDHPYVKEHPEWFRQRPDGSIRYAENPPKKYQDIYNVDFECEEWKGLWLELRSVVEFWAERGVRTFRVDNPHTKALPFWEWCFSTLREKYPDLIFLAEAFTRPHQMYALAKLGFSQSYTYFTWRYNKRDFEQYLGELFQSEVVDFYRPSFWPNTPDILPPYLRTRPVFQARLVMAATMSSSYGIYGPVFELMENEPHPAREEYLGSEKYEIRDWNLDDPASLKPLMTRINEIRYENPALHNNRSLKFHYVDNDQLLAFSKQDGDNRILVVINFDANHAQTGFVHLDMGALGLSDNEAYHLEDLIIGERYTWEGPRNFIRLDPHYFPAHILKITPERREQSFDSYMAQQSV